MLILAFPFQVIGLTVSIRLYDEQVYFPDSPVDLFITVQNETPESVRFRMADNRVFNLDFDVTGPTNRRLESTRQFITGRTTNQVYYRTVTLEPGERFSFVERLSDYVQIEEPAVYTVQAAFYPELFSGRSRSTVRSNPITLSVRPGFTPETRMEMRYAAVTERALQRERKSPDEVVEYMLEARRQGNWDRFFLYLNLEKLYRQLPDRDRRFRRMSEAQQLEELREYRARLEEQPRGEDSLLVRVPDQYEILQTSYSPSEGTVVARMAFDFDRYRERKRYTFSLERRNGFWEIIGYEVTNLPNEAIR
ncbi:MAG: hypothetical protein EA427_02060 [Spirochaetaceae bacterium]|nr:MAG: hypothetical protein EA427_02060 [Spirochaetaceae bacterium]